MKKLILRSFQSPGDILMLTAAVRDLHAAYPGEFQTDVRTSADALWLNNPHITRLSDRRRDVQHLDMHYPLIEHSNQRPYHFLHGFTQYLEQQLHLRIPLTRFCGDVHLSEDEKQLPPFVQEFDLGERFWIVVAGGKYDFTAKWWNPANYQKVVDYFQGRIQFVQCGEKGHWHPRLTGAIDLVGKTSLRDFVRLMHHADGVLCPVTFAMHLAAAVETRPDRPVCRPCVVVAGGREPPHWEAYPHHQFLSTVGALSCCMEGGCWRSRCQVVGDGDDKDYENVCEQPVQVAPDLRIPRCLEMITADDVIRKIDLYLEGEVDHVGLKANGVLRRQQVENVVDLPALEEELPPPPELVLARKVLIVFRHGLGDAVQLTTVLQHLNHCRPESIVDVAALVGKHSAFHGLCRNVFVLDRDELPQSYDCVFDLEWHECQEVFADSPSTKAERCLREVFDLQPLPELCTYKIRRGERARGLASSYLEQICSGRRHGERFPAVLIHYEGNTATLRKNISAEIVRAICDVILEAGTVPVILDWDHRSKLADGEWIHTPHPNATLWGPTGTGDAEVLAALIELSTLMIGIDSGPLHVAGATTTPTIGVWTGHHPLHHFGHADNVTHLVPQSHAELLLGDRAVGEKYFRENYRFQTYRNLAEGLKAIVREKLTDSGEGLNGTFWLSNPKQEAAPSSSFTHRQRTVPTVLIAAKRDQPLIGYLVLMENGRISARYEHPSGHLHGFARYGDVLWTVDSLGALHQVQVNAGSIRLVKISQSDLACEAHDLVAVNGRLMTTSPQQNAIAVYDPGRNEWSMLRPWPPMCQFPQDEAPPDGWDMHHLNSVAHDGERFIISFFSRQSRPKGMRWRDWKLDEGTIIRWGAGGFDDQPVATGVYCPHSLRMHQSRLWWVDSFRGYVCRDDGWRSPALGAFLRGMAFADGRCIVGLSKSRVNDHPVSEVCGLCVFHPDHPESSQEIVVLPEPYTEVFDVIAM